MASLLTSLMNVIISLELFFLLAFAISGAVAAAKGELFPRPEINDAVDLPGIPAPAADQGRMAA